MGAGKPFLIAKLAFIFVILLVMMIPLSMIRGQIEDRERTRDSAIGEISHKWGAPQAVNGPMLAVPFTRVKMVESSRVISGRNGREETVIERKPAVEIDTAYFLPETLAVSGRLNPQIRYRGIFEAVLFSAGLEMRGTFAPPDFGKLQIPEKDVRWKDAEVILGIADSHGVRENIVMKWDGVLCSFSPSAMPPLWGGGGVIGVRVPVSASNSGHAFSINLNLNGSGELTLAPFGKETHVELAADWPSPSFSGAYLPSKRDVTAKSFSASWDIFYLARRFPQQWTGANVSAADFSAALFGVKLITPANSYQKTLRSTKYGLLCISLTFMVFFMFEIFNVKSVHPVQYLLVSLALCLFYMLLLSTSEFLGFGPAYLIASVATVAVIAGYSRAVLGGGSRAVVMGGGLALLYGYFYILLQLEDYALLMGSVGLFAVLAGIMYFTRRVDWYASDKTLS